MPRSRTEPRGGVKFVGHQKSREALPEGEQNPSGKDELGPTPRLEWLDPKIVAWPDGWAEPAADRDEWFMQWRAVKVYQIEDGTYQGWEGIFEWSVARRRDRKILCIVQEGSKVDVEEARSRTELKNLVEAAQRALMYTEVERWGEAALEDLRHALRPFLQQRER